ncbi:hypothetical protein E2C01_062984 [Portunus trituberculatus]|uniref:Uncharacterized protein n=1 Tax=Portunus trituberculatus TaxID=210409 RepID=A0A5B7HGW4_PORTR|nr:hypothetical protein [Portunus trituberculatus]
MISLSDSATTPACLTSIPRVSCHVTGRQLLNESGIRTGDRREDTRGPFSLALAKATEPDRTLSGK